MTLYIKNMVCDRCVMVVRAELERAGFAVQSVGLGEAVLDTEPTPAQKARLSARLEALGFELLEDRKSRIVETIKNSLIELVRAPQGVPSLNLSEYLAERLRLDYRYLSNLFSETQGLTIEKYYISQRIERVKELLLYNELTLSEIAFRMGYSSVAHLSAQFKRTTGLTPSNYKRFGAAKRRPLDKL